MKRVLLDQGVPAPLKTLIAGDIATAYKSGWSELANGELIAVAEASGFDVFITCDQNLKYQQNLAHRRIAVVVLRSTAWPLIKRHAAAISEAVAVAEPGSYIELLEKVGRRRS